MSYWQGQPRGFDAGRCTQSEGEAARGEERLVFAHGPGWCRRVLFACLSGTTFSAAARAHAGRPRAVLMYRLKSRSAD